MPIEYSFSGDYREYCRLLRRFALDKLIIRINSESAKIMNAPAGEIGYGVISANYPIINAKTRARTSQDVFVSGWNLIDLAYNAIISSNDYRGKPIETDDELYLLVSATEAIRESRESEYLDSIPDNDKTDFFLYLWGFAGEQFKVQALAKAFQNASRELYILFESSKKVKHTPNISDIVVEETGVTWQTTITSLFLAWFGSTVSACLSDVTQKVKWDDRLKREDFCRVIERYTATYTDVRNSKLGRQYLYTKPFIKTQHNNIISANCFLNLFLYEHSILWIVRDYYNKENNQIFTSVFGNYFEAYFEELMGEYLASDNYTRIPEGNTRRADWRIQISNYKLLVEQKSAMLGLHAKQQESDINALKTFIDRQIVKALHQLEDTERYLNDGKYIKIILLYEGYLQSEVLETVFALESCDVADDHYYWLMTIEEMEMLLYTCNHNRDLFFCILQEKIKREIEKSPDGRSVSKILYDNGIDANQHLNQTKFVQYGKLAENNARKHLSGQ